MMRPRTAPIETAAITPGDNLALSLEPSESRIGPGCELWVAEGDRVVGAADIVVETSLFVMNVLDNSNEVVIVVDEYSLVDTTVVWALKLVVEATKEVNLSSTFCRVELCDFE